MQIMTYNETLLVKRHRGTLPVILTCPHGGSAKPENVDEREDTKTPVGCDFQDLADSGTAAITEGAAQKILDLTGLSPYVVRARFHRQFIDVNRTLECAFTDADGQPFYEEYHSRIDGYVDEILSQNQDRGFLFDIHGTTVIPADPADLYLGTANGASLAADFDRRELFRQHGLHGLLKAARRLQETGGQSQVFRYTISPADEATPETSQVSGGFTIRTYGARINSVQIEIATPIREDAVKRGFLIEDLALAIINSVRRYAPF